MVNTRIVSRFTAPLPVGDGADRTIPGGPLYQAHEVLELLESGGSQAITPLTRKCLDDSQKWSLDKDDLLQLLKLAVRSGRFRGSEWCEKKHSGPWAACDAYSVIRMEWIAKAHKEIGMEYYIKFAIGTSGKILLLVSCHPSETRR